jgi:hypothetical protein
MDRTLFTQLYSDLWSKGLWAAPWSKAVADLTPQQAVWKPSPERKSIWQFVTHVTFWRNYMIEKTRTGEVKISEDEIHRRQFAEPAEPTGAAWNDARQKLEESHRAFLALAGDEKTPMEKIAPVIGHDAYHLGQVMYVRALQGLKPIE